MKAYLIEKFLPSILLQSLILLVSCGPRKYAASDVSFQSDSLYFTKYAKLFKIGFVDSHRAILVMNPWDSTQIWGGFIVLNRKEKYSLPRGYQKIYQPVRTIATTSSTLFSHLQGFNGLKHLSGVTDTAYIINPQVKLRIRKGLIEEIGVGNQIFDEKLIACDPDVVFFSLFPGQDFSKYEKIGILALPLADYLESTPLGRAEWIKFTGVILGKEKEADSIFRAIENNYLKIKSLASKAQERYKIVDGMLEGSIWYVSAAQSYMACLYNDAGLDYLFYDKAGTGSVPLSFEEVLSRSAAADYWRILKGGTALNHRNALLRLDPRYEFMKVFRNGKILYCNVSEVPLYEEGNIRPDFILADLFFLTHPEMQSDYQPHYYQLLP